MTRIEWENELKKNMKGLPESEQTRVLEYYNEMFADGIEFGKSEKQLIAEFGNPVDVAYRIMTEYGMDERVKDGERTIEPPDRTKNVFVETPPDFWAGSKKKKAQTPETPEKSKNNRKENAFDAERKERKTGGITLGSTLGFIAEVVFLGWLPLTSVVVLVALGISVLAAGFGFAAGAVWAVIASLMPGLTAGVRIVGFAMALVAAGLACFIIPQTATIAKGIGKCSVGITKGFFGWYFKGGRKI